MISESWRWVAESYERVVEKYLDSLLISRFVALLEVKALGNVRLISSVNQGPRYPK